MSPGCGVLRDEQLASDHMDGETAELCFLTPNPVLFALLYDCLLLDPLTWNTFVFQLPIRLRECEFLNNTDMFYDRALHMVYTK